MNTKYNVFLVSDSTGETLDRIFLALKAQFENFNNNLHHFSFVRTEAQITTLLEKCDKLGNSIVLYTLVEPAVTSFLIKKTQEHKIPCFGVLDYLIPKFEIALNRKANRKPALAEQAKPQQLFILQTKAINQQIFQWSQIKKYPKTF